MTERDIEYLGDAVIASFDGYQIWLRTDDGNNNRIALEPEVYAKLQAYAAMLQKKYKDEPTTTATPEGEGP